MINTAPTTSLRERMIEDMKLHRLSRATQRNYLRDVTRFATWLGRPPDTATDEDLRRYQIEQSETGLGAPAMNTAVSALRFFYARTLDRQDLTRKLHRVKHARALPTVSAAKKSRGCSTRRPASSTKRSCLSLMVQVFARPRLRNSRSAMSIASGCCFGSSAARGAVTATPCSRSISCCFCANGGRWGVGKA
jgi:Phage integrase, N-terminal SAM-like domain